MNRAKALKCTTPNMNIWELSNLAHIYTHTGSKQVSKEFGTAMTTEVLTLAVKPIRLRPPRPVITNTTILLLIILITDHTPRPRFKLYHFSLAICLTPKLSFQLFYIITTFFMVLYCYCNSIQILDFWTPCSIPEPFDKKMKLKLGIWICE